MKRERSHTRSPRPPAARIAAASAALLLSVALLSPIASGSVAAGADAEVASSRVPEGPARVEPTILRLWGEEPAPLIGPDEGVEAIAAGLILRSGSRERVIGWHRVHSVSGPGEAEVEAYLPDARRAWRGVSRLRRGDARAAEPEFEALFIKYKDMLGPTAAAISEGLTRCRLRRGAVTLSIEPWLTWRASRRRTEPEPEGIEGLRPLLDPDLGLIPGLHPFWSPTPATRAFASQPIGRVTIDPGGDGALPAEAAEGARIIGTPEVLGSAELALLALYRRAARVACGMEPDLDEESWRAAWESEDEGVEFVREIVSAITGGLEQRAASRDRLRVRINRYAASPDRHWGESWCRVARGLSLVRERDPALVRRGVVDLLHAPARFADESPQLAAYALMEAAAAMERLGQPEAAGRLRGEAERRFPAVNLADVAPAVRVGRAANDDPRGGGGRAAGSLNRLNEPMRSSE